MSKYDEPAETPGADLLLVKELAQQAMVGRFTANDGREYVVLVDAGGGLRHHLLTKDAEFFPPAPQYIRNHLQMTSKESFVAYVNDFAHPTARTFADLAAGKLTTVLDYHAGGDRAGDALLAQLCAHRVTLTLQESEEWKRWKKISGGLMDQFSFVRFLEENASDIVSPSGADILELARDMSATRKVDFRNAVRLQNGDTSFEYAAETEARSKSGAIEVPNKFQLSIPVYYGEPPVSVYAFLRYDVSEGGGLKLGIELHRPEYVKQAVFEQIGYDIIERTAKPLHYGAAPG